MGDESPKNKVKFLCSHAGKVLPRPSDGLLKYVGGETRVISVSRDVTFSELMTKLRGMTGEGDTVLKYQLVTQDLDALVSVRNDEDLKHMIEEHDRHETGIGSPLLRTFLFPAKPVVKLENQQGGGGSYWLEQRYIDAINGIIIIRSSPKAASSSACSSPHSISPDSYATSVCESPFHTSRHKSMHKVRSSPSLTNLSNNNAEPQQHPHHHHHHHQQHVYAPSSRPPQDPQLRPPPPPPPPGAAGGVGYYYASTTTNRQPRGLGGGGGVPYAAYHHDDSIAAASYAYPGGGIIERVHSVPRSPRRIIWE